MYKYILAALFSLNSILKINVKEKHRRDIFVIGGDFNLPDINWEEQTIINRQYPIKTNQTFLEIVADNGLEQIVDFPTRKDNTLDLMLLSHPAYKLRCKPLPSIGNSDHDIVLLDIACKPFKPKPVRRKIYLWKKADIYKIKEDLESFGNTFRNIGKRDIGYALAPPHQQCGRDGPVVRPSTGSYLGRPEVDPLEPILFPKLRI